jgi:hypothetical protein
LQSLVLLLLLAAVIAVRLWFSMPAGVPGG